METRGDGLAWGGIGSSAIVTVCLLFFYGRAAGALVPVGTVVPAGQWSIMIPPRADVLGTREADFISDNWFSLPYAFPDRESCVNAASELRGKIVRHFRSGRPLNGEEHRKALALVAQVEHAVCVKSDGSERFRARTNDFAATSGPAY